MLLTYISVFVISCLLLYFSGELVVGGLVRIARFLGWREFVVAFFVMAFAASLPNFFLGITSAFRKVPELCFGDVLGNNIIAITIAVALAVLISKKELIAESKMVQVTLFFTIVAAILPLIMIMDGFLSRMDGLILIGLFIIYSLWLFSKKERFSKIYDEYSTSILKDFKIFVKDIIRFFLGLFILLLATQGIVTSAQFFANDFNVSIIVIGILITGVGNALPEVYFSIVSARKGEGWMVLGNLMGAVVVPSTLVLGIVALISPIRVMDFSPIFVARLFLIIAVISFFLFVRSGKKIDRKEAIFLLFLYILFLTIEILIK